MNAREMHYDFKTKLNKVDSQKYTNLLVPEIDWALNEAQDIIIKMIAFPRTPNQFGVEIGQRTIDDLRNIVVNASSRPIVETGTKYQTVSLPSDYKFYMKAVITATKGTCSATMEKIRVIRHDDEAEKSPFDCSNFEWREVNIRFYQGVGVGVPVVYNGGIKVFNDGTFTMNTFLLDYIREPKRIHNAQDFNSTIGAGTYTLLDGTVLTGSQSCELSPNLHREIVDLAVLITTGNIQSPDIANKEKKVNLSQI